MIHFLWCLTAVAEWQWLLVNRIRTDCVASDLFIAISQLVIQLLVCCLNCWLICLLNIDFDLIYLNDTCECVSCTCVKTDIGQVFQRVDQERTDGWTDFFMKINVYRPY